MEDKEACKCGGLMDFILFNRYNEEEVYYCESCGRLLLKECPRLFDTSDTMLWHEHKLLEKK